MVDLAIGPGLKLPLDAVTETFAILAKRGSGKTYTAKVLVEELLDAGQRVCVIDPVGVWWGLRSSADGKHGGQPVVIFGGDHADVPLEQTAGELLADLIVDQDIAAVLDLSSLSKRASRRFMTDFLERLYHRNRDPLHVVVDEADAFAPQRTAAEGARLLGAMEDLVRRGRARGIGVTLITQRPAVLNKDVLTQAEVLIAMRITAPRDAAAIDEWVKQHDVEDQAAEVKASLPSLPTGTAWIWSPSWLGVLQKVAVRRARTFDSSATPKAGERRVVPRRMAKVDLTQLGEQIAATVERAKAADPRELRQRIAQLEHELAAERAKPEPEPVEVRVEVPVLAPEIVDQIEAALSPAAALLEEVQETLAKHRMWAEQQLSAPPKRPQSVPPATPRRPRPEAVSTQPKPSPVRPSVPSPDDVRLGKTERSILSVLAQHGPRTHDQLALLTGYSRKASTIGVSLGKLRKAGFVEPGQPITATQAGIDWLGDAYEPLPTGAALVAYWRSKFGLTEQRVLDAVLAVYPHETSQQEIAEVTGYSPTASTIGVALGRLRKVGVIDGWRISDDFASTAGIEGER